MFLSTFRKKRKFYYPRTSIHALLAIMPLTFFGAAVPVLPCRADYSTSGSTVSLRYRRVTNGRTDGHCAKAYTAPCRRNLDSKAWTLARWQKDVNGKTENEF